MWATCITQQLNHDTLSEPYVALPELNLAGTVKVDVATAEEEDKNAIADGPSPNGGVATAVWAPPKPPLVVKVDLSNLDVIEIRVHFEETMTLVGAIELVSPANKDRPDSRTAFVSKIAAYLQANVGVVVVDIVTERLNNLHAQLMDLLDAGDAAVAAVGSEQYAVAYRNAGKGKRARIEMWPADLAVGQPLPVLPLWIGPRLAVPLDLETSYKAACDSVRLR